jgi:hypothetical protein
VSADLLGQGDDDACGAADQFRGTAQRRAGMFIADAAGPEMNSIRVVDS